MYEYGASTIPDIGYNHQYEKGALRIASGFHFSSDLNESDSHLSEGSGYSLSPRIGYEFHRWFSRIRVQYGADVVYSLWRFKSDQFNDNPYYSSTHSIKLNEYGIRPILGITLFLNSSVSFSAESYFDMSYFRRTDEDVESGDTSVSTSQGMTARFGPLGIVSINFHF